MAPSVRSAAHRTNTLIAALALLAAACGPTQGSATSSGTAWVGTTTSEDATTSVVTESGSLWGGTARLVEEASIGVATGEPHYMFGRVSSLAADHERIYIAETRPPVIRVYRHDGIHCFDIGGPGQGPGEFAFPASIALMPDGRLMVRDDDNSRINFFSRDGELLDDWQLAGGFGTSRQSIVTPDGTVLSPQPVERNPGGGRSIWGMVPYGPDGKPGEPIRDPQPDPDFEDRRFPRITTTSTDGRTLTDGGGLVPFSPRARAEFLTSGAVFEGTSDRYQLEIHQLDGSRLVIRRIVDPFPVLSEEADWIRRYTTALRRSSNPGWTWNAPGIPDTKPFFEYVVGDQSGRLWVGRIGRGVRVETCDEDPQPGTEFVRCWQDELIIDVFDAAGRYLGDVEPPPGFELYDLRSAFIRDDMVIFQVEDELGTIMVKRFRLVLPAGNGED